MAPPDSGGSGPPSADLLVTTELLTRAKNGDRQALEVLTARYLPRLVRWATGRLPASARSLFDTHDVVQETLLHAIRGIDGIEVRGPGGFQAYVRQAVLNRIRDQIRWTRRRHGREEISEDLPDDLPSPLESAIGVDLLERYERALTDLSEEERQLLHLRIELDFNYEEIAAITGKPSRDAVRMAIKRALLKLAESMGHER
ncbi:MAG: putative RNA polymerase sigma factor cnrH [bacterium]|nr:MAG: putative RNA polymerase sigma factor cnrH [bacterium]